MEFNVLNVAIFNTDKYLLIMTGALRVFKILKSLTTVTFGDPRVQVEVTGIVILIKLMAQSSYWNWTFTTFDFAI